jgi:UDP-2-acetamido-3-amino-2,3-dideoxy-glucuronate N-acetyltransferase
VSVAPIVHETAIVDQGAVLGEGAQIWHFTHVCAGARVGARCVLGQNVFVGPGVVIGAGSKVQNNVSVYAGVELGEDVFVGPSVVFTNVRTPRAHVSRKGEFESTVVGKGATIGANATIVCGHPIGAYAFVAAGAVVTKAVAPYAVVMGSPALRRGFACRCGELLRGTGAVLCVRCRDRYRIDGEECALLEVS